jgi:hypothetical protein
LPLPAGIGIPGQLVQFQAICFKLAWRGPDRMLELRSQWISDLNGRLSYRGKAPEPAGMGAPDTAIVDGTEPFGFSQNLTCSPRPEQAGAALMVWTDGESGAKQDPAERRHGGAQVRDDAVHEIAMADNALRGSLASHAAPEALVKAARTAFDSAYRRGVGSITGLTIAETQLLQAKDATTGAWSTALSSAATLALATGAPGSAPDDGNRGKP